MRVLSVFFETFVASRARGYTPCDFAQNSLSGFLANLLVGEYPQSPFEHTINCVATPPAEAACYIEKYNVFVLTFSLKIHILIVSK